MFTYSPPKSRTFTIAFAIIAVAPAIAPVTAIAKAITPAIAKAITPAIALAIALIQSILAKFQNLIFGAHDVKLPIVHLSLPKGLTPTITVAIAINRAIIIAINRALTIAVARAAAKDGTKVLAAAPTIAQNFAVFSAIAIAFKALALGLEMYIFQSFNYTSQ